MLLAQGSAAQETGQPYEGFRTIGYTIVFPANKIDGKMTFIGDKGFNQSIAGRFDLTVECIRRHYLEQTSPLAATLSRYADCFALFVPEVPA